MKRALRSAGEVLLKVLAAFLILEPIWMLLPFAGFLYGSVFHIQTLSRDPATAWLTHFVFPVLTLGPLGPILALLGLLLFAAGAIQIYSARIRKKGLVTTGLYRFVRHPQYISLTLFGLGILLTWGRAIAYVAFAAMMFLYYWLAKVEEHRCRQAFGEAYEAYRARTSFIVPGDRAVAGWFGKLRLGAVPLPARVVLGLGVTALLTAGSLALIRSVKHALRTVPCLAATVPLPGADREAEARAARFETGEGAGVPFVFEGRLAVARGPWRAGAAPGFAESVLLRMSRSDTLRPFLAFLEESDRNAVLAFVIPREESTTPGRPGPPADAESRGPPPAPEGPDRVRLILFRMTLDAGATLADALARVEARRLEGAVIAPVDLARPPDADFVDGKLFTPGPLFPAEERFRAILHTFHDPRRGSAPAVSVVPGSSSSTTLVMVKAPILRTRLDPAFAEEILRRLKGSKRFRERLARVGAGPELVPVAFPRPGPNWYREHHGTPRISLFVMLVRPAAPGSPPEALFRPGGREIAGAFTAEMDFAVRPPEDSIRGFETIGPYRDLEERWAFFLSGL